MLVFSVACSGNDDDITYDYDGNLYFSVIFDTALVHDDYRGFRLYLQSEETFPCFNYEIITTEKYSDGNMEVHILEVALDGPCATALGPAQKRISVRTGSDEFDLMFFNARESDRYHVIFVGDSAVVVAVDTSFTRYYPPITFPF